MPITVRKAVEADIPAMGALDVAGYRNSAYRRTMFPPERRVQPGDGDALEWFARGAKRALESSTATHQYIVAVEGDAVVGMAIWCAPQPPPPASTEDNTSKDGEKQSQKTDEKPSGPPPGLPSYIGYEPVMEANKEIQTLLAAQDTLDSKTRSNMWSMFSFLTIMI